MLFRSPSPCHPVLLLPSNQQNPLPLLSSLFSLFLHPHFPTGSPPNLLRNKQNISNSTDISLLPSPHTYFLSYSSSSSLICWRVSSLRPCLRPLLLFNNLPYLAPSYKAHLQPKGNHARVCNYEKKISSSWYDRLAMRKLQ